MRAACTLLLALAVGAPATSHAATITVNTTSTAASLPDACTLRAAVSAALLAQPVGGCPAGDFQDFAQPLPNTIVLPPGAVFTYTDADTSAAGSEAALPLIAIQGKLTLEGNGATIERSDQLPFCEAGGPPAPERFRLINVFGAGPHAMLELRNLTLRNGCAFGAGGAISFEQALGSLTLDGVRVVGSRGTSGSGVYFASAGALEIRRSHFLQNVASQSGALFMTVGIGHAARISGSTFSGNFAGNSILRGNVSGSLELRDNTVTGNVTTSLAAGVGDALLLSGAGQITLLHNTLVDNDTLSGRAILAIGSTANVRLQGNWFAGNADPNCNFGTTVVQVTGVNLSSDASCAQFTVVQPGQIQPLTNYGGAVPTRPPTPGSVAIDVSASCNHPATGQPLGTDARGVPRPQDGDSIPGALCDAGAAEFVRNQAPAIILPAAQATLAGVPLSLAPPRAIVVSDPDARELPVELRLEPANGVVDFDASGLDCATGNGIADPVAVCRGSVAQLNAALATLAYTPRPSYLGTDALRVELDDLGAGGDDMLPRGAAEDLAITVVASAAIIAVNGPIDFQDVVVGTQSAAVPVQISNTGNAPLTGLFLSAPPIGSGFQVSSGCSVIAPGEACAFEVRFAPATVGAQAFELTIASNAANGAVSVMLLGNGIADPDAVFGNGFE